VTSVALVSRDTLIHSRVTLYTTLHGDTFAHLATLRVPPPPPPPPPRHMCCRRRRLLHSQKKEGRTKASGDASKRLLCKRARPRIFFCRGNKKCCSLLLHASCSIPYFERPEAGFLVRVHPDPCLILVRTCPDPIRAVCIKVKVHPCLDLNFAGSRQKKRPLQ
jgi:hypothetical protein